MSGRPLRASHPQKVRVADFGPDPTLTAEQGWVNMDVRWLVTSQSVGSQETVFGITVFPPDGRHDVHRHPNAEEVEYLVEGQGVARVGDDDVLMEVGDIVFAAANEWHGFRNSSSSERAVMVWCYGGAPSLEAAGYVREADEQDS